MNNQILKILCVDDDPSVLCFLDDYLRFSSHNVDIVRNGSTAYHYVRTGSYDLVFMDINMPVMDGTESIRAIRERNESVYIVAMSGYPQNMNFYGANEFLAKPFSPARLQKLLDMAVEWKNRQSPHVEEKLCS